MLFLGANCFFFFFLIYQNHFGIITSMMSNPLEKWSLLHEQVMSTGVKQMSLAKYLLISMIHQHDIPKFTSSFYRY